MTPFTFTEREISAMLSKQRRPRGSSILVENSRQAAVLLPLFFTQGEWHLLFTKRTESVQDHKGQVSFPGGAVEEEDRDIYVTALRETSEEIGIPPESVRTLGILEDFITITGFRITPVVGSIPWPISLNVSRLEVNHVFWSPLSWLAKKENYEIKPCQIIDGQIIDVVYFKPYTGEIIWGATAHITLDLLITLEIVK